MRRYAQHAVPDSILEQRLSLLRRDVTTWNILDGSKKSQRNFSFAQPHSAWAKLQQGADVLMVAARFGSKIRVDFFVYTDATHGPEFFARKAGLFAGALMAGPTPEATSPEEAQRRIQNFSLESNCVQGSGVIAQAICSLFRSTCPT